MALELKVHPSFFKEFATKTWVSTYEIIQELIENAFDEDATKVIVTVLRNGDIVIEDNAGMNFDSVNKFLILGSPHKSNENLSPKFKRIRTGRYGTGRLSFLTAFDSMKIRTRLDGFNKTLVINGDSLENLANGKSLLQELHEPPLKRNGTEIFLKGSKIRIDIIKLLKEIKKLSILKYPLFEVYIKNSEQFREWNTDESQLVKSPDVQGYKITVNITDPLVMGEIIIAKRPLTADEKGIAIMVGNHMVLRSTFGFDNKLNRVTGYVKCDQLTSRFADKSALIENDVYFRFNQSMKEFIIARVLPSLTEYEDVLITREESKIYKEIDKVMGQAVLETLQIDEELQGFESVDVSSGEYIDPKESVYSNMADSLPSLPLPPSPASLLQNGSLKSNELQKKDVYNKDTTNFKDIDVTYCNSDPTSNNHIIEDDTLLKLSSNNDSKGFSEDEHVYNTSEKKEFDLSLKDHSLLHSADKGEHKKNNLDVFQYRDATPYSAVSKVVDNTHYLHNDDATNLTDKSVPQTSVFSSSMVSHEQINSQQHVLGDTINSQLNFYNMDQQNSNISPDTNSFIKKTVRKPVLKKTFTLKKIGYKVIPYEDENDSRYCFTNENIVFVNKAHSTYKVESERGEEFLFRHITNIVAEVVVGSRYPEARDILEIQNKLISEAIKLHDYSLLKK